MSDTYDRELIARMLEAFADWGALGGGFKPEAAMEQARLLRAADNAAASGVRTASIAPAEAKGEAVAWRNPTPYGVGYSFASEEVMRDLVGYVAESFDTPQPACGEAVAEVGPGWTLRFVGATPIAELCRQHPELHIGTKLYTHPAAQAPAVRVTSEMANLRSAVMRLDGQSRRDTLVAYRKLEAALGQGRGRE